MSKTILITGTSSGFGKLMAISLAGEGHSVLAAMRETKDKNAEIAEELAAIDNIEVVEMDVTSEQSVNNAVAFILRRYGAIDVVVNNAGVSASGLMEATSMELMQELFDINYFGTVRVYQSVLPSMRKNLSGLFINISSCLGMVALPYRATYSASKFALEGFTEAVRDEIARFNIENVTVQCGPSPTGLTMKTGFNADRLEIIEQYGSVTRDAITLLSRGLRNKIIEFEPDPQQVANGVLELVKMPKGTRPNHFPIDVIAGGRDVDLINAREDAKGKWMTKYGFTLN
jgi:NAD(P)-dependent dehydrogenase (short-subunit alcohol dehydrogenase family)